MDTMNKCWSNDVGKLVIRLLVGGLMLFHGIHIVMHGVDWLGPMLQAHNVPDFVRYGVYVGEVLGPILVILGFWTRLGAFIIAANMIVAVWLAHPGDFLKLDDMSGGWKMEMDAWYFFAAVAVLFLGAGRYSIDYWWKSGSSDTVPQTEQMK